MPRVRRVSRTDRRTGCGNRRHAPGRRRMHRRSDQGRDGSHDFEGGRTPYQGARSDTAGERRFALIGGTQREWILANPAAEFAKKDNNELKSKEVVMAVAVGPVKRQRVSAKISSAKLSRARAENLRTWSENLIECISGNAPYAHFRERDGNNSRTPPTPTRASRGATPTLRSAADGRTAPNRPAADPKRPPPSEPNPASRHSPRPRPWANRPPPGHSCGSPPHAACAPPGRPAVRLARLGPTRLRRA